MKLIIFPDVDIWNFVLSGLSHRDDVLLFPLKRNSNLVQRVFRRYGNELPLPSCFVLGARLRKSIQSLKEGDALIIAEYTDSALVKAVASIIPEGVSRYVWLWNHKGNNKAFAKSLSTIKKHAFRVVTFDERDAETFGFLWHSQFFNIRPYQKKCHVDSLITTDFFFVGYSKNRIEEINYFRSLLCSYTCNFVAIDKTSDYIPYTRYMEMALQSRCIVEIVHTGDSACTLRPLEAMTIHRKLLTNNPAVRSYSFYHPQNIFILGEDDIEKLPVFLHSPYVPLSSEIVDCYEVNTWIEVFK